MSVCLARSSLSISAERLTLGRAINFFRDFGALGTFQIKSFVSVLGQIFPTKGALAIHCVDFKRVGFSHDPRKDLGGLRASIATLLSADAALLLA
jgi:hypothetical protein